MYFAGTLYWIVNVMAEHGGLSSLVSVLITAGLVAVMASFVAAFAWIVRHLAGAAGQQALLAAPLVWVATELGRTYLYTGFPWVLVGYSQTEVLPIAQLASVVGIYGLSALVVGFNAALAAWGLDIVAPVARDGRARFAGPGSALTMAAVVITVAAWGSWRIARSELTSAGSPVRVGLVQGNVPQGEKWDPARASSIFASYLELTRQAIREGAGLVIWPESSTPFSFEEDRQAADAVRQLAREGHADILLGSNQIERGSEPRFFNAAFLVGPDGAQKGVYRKMHLVPFGEYVPLKSLLFFAGPLVEAVSAFSPGTEATIFPATGGRMSTAICYEVVFPNLVRQSVAEGSQLLTTITNDAWFGRTVAPHQHFAQASMRAIENGRYLVRAANTGISGIVDPYGRVLAKSPLFTQDVVVGEARFIEAQTMYTRVGDVVAYASLVLTIGAVLAAGTRTGRPGSTMGRG